MNVRVRLSIYVDGSVSEEDRRRTRRVFPHASVLNVREGIDLELFEADEARHILDTHRFGRVLLLKLTQQAKGDTLFSDADVLLFDTPTAFEEAFEAGSNMHMIEPDAWVEPDPLVAEYARRHDLELNPSFNSGVLLMHEASLSLPRFNELADGIDETEIGHFFEQSSLAVLGGEVGSRAAPPDAYRITGEGSAFWKPDIDYGDVTARHFVGNVRHRMYTDGYMHLANAFAVEP